IFQKLAACPAETKVVLIDGSRPLDPGRVAAAAPPPAAAKPEDLAVPGVTLLTATAGGAPGYVHAADRHGVFWKFVLRELRGGTEGEGQKVTLGTFARRVLEDTRNYVTETYKA